MKKLIYVASSIINYVDADIADTIKFNYDIDIKFWTGAGSFSHARYGQEDLCPFKISNGSIMPCPTLDLTFEKTFEEITDARSIELLNLCRESNKKLAVFWSGGIDSTVILAAIIKNWPKSDLERVEVFFNQISIIENYYFFKDQIFKNNLTCSYTVDYSFQINDKNLLDSYIVTDGEPADKLWFVMAGFSYARNYGNNSLEQSWWSQFKNLIGYISSFVGTETAIEFYNKIGLALNEFPHVITVGQWFSWINYNYYFQGHIYMAKWQPHKDKNSQDWNNFQNFYKPWFLAEDYQLWAWGKHSQNRYKFTNLTDYKKEAKQYIFDLTGENFYYKFKTKNGSDKFRLNPTPMEDVLLFDDGTSIGRSDPNLSQIVRSYLK